MLDISRDIQSLSNFKRNTKECDPKAMPSLIAQMKQTGERPNIILDFLGKLNRQA